MNVFRRSRSIHRKNGRLCALGGRATRVDAGGCGIGLAAWIGKREEDKTYLSDESTNPGRDIKVIISTKERGRGEKTKQGRDSLVKTSIITDNQPIDNERRERRRSRRNK